MHQNSFTIISSLNKTILLTLISFILLTTGCEQQKTTPVAGGVAQLSGKLNITGSSTIAPLAAELAAIFESKNPQLRINVQTGGSSRGLADIRQGVSDIGMVSRKLKTEENDIQAHLLANDGISIIVHKDNPITSLTEEQIKSIYLGKIKNWKSLNGVDKKITVINKAEGRSTLEVFLHFFKLKNVNIKPDVIIGDNEQGVKLVSRNRYAIAYVSIGTAEYNIKSGTTIKALPLDGVEATTEKLASGEFPLSRELNFVTKNKPSPLAQAFLDYSRSNEARKTIEEFGFVPIK
ncbi:MAG: phosphate ABC transporter substrate-binding protein [Gammaproteobacteria bacterium]|nr:phosphate ABC transporter substrate-binding protein [Gammaproteobacteria bacterium]